MLDIATPKKHPFYYKILNLWLNFIRRNYLAYDDAKANAYYEFNLDHFFKPEHYISIFNNTIPLNKIDTAVNIQPEILGLSTKKVIKQYGYPTFTFTEKDITIFVYKWRFNGLKNRCKVHFYKNNAFLINHDYQLLSSPDKIFIYNAVIQKYLSPAINSDGILNCKIVDQHNNIIFIQEVLGLTINYLSNAQSEWFAGITMDIEDEKNKANSKTELANKKFYAVV